MKIISKTFPGITICCSGCGALLAYTSADIYGNVIYCPICKATTEVPFDKNYDGLVKEDKNVLES